MEKKDSIVKGNTLGRLHDREKPGDCQSQKADHRADKETSDRSGVAALVLILLGIISVGFLVAEAAALVHHARFGWYLWPLIVCSDVFAISSFGFFVAEGKAEKVYGVCAVISFIAAILQMVILF